MLYSLSIRIFIELEKVVSSYVRCTNLGAENFQKMKQPYIHTQVQLDRILRIDIKTKTSLFVCFFSRNSDFASKRLRLISPKSLETPELI